MSPPAVDYRDGSDADSMLFPDGNALPATPTGLQRQQALAGPRLPAAGQVKLPHSLFMGTGLESRPTRKLNTPSPPAGDKVDELRTDSTCFDPREPSLRTQLLALLELSDATSFEEMAGFTGGLNDGIWFATDETNISSKELVIKLVRGHRIAPNILTEAENLAKMQREKPAIVDDQLVAFPIKVASCVDARGSKHHDVIIMRKVPGERLAELICRKYYSKQESHLLEIFEKLGKTLFAFHARYDNTQHGDFQPSNIFYDEKTDALSFIDIGGMGVPTMDDDVSHFCQSMNLLANAYGPTLHLDLMAAFRKGYGETLA